MPALALKSSDYDRPSFLPQRNLSTAQGWEARKICEGTIEAFRHLRGTETYKSAEIDAVKRLLKHGSGYASLSYLTRNTGLRVEDFHQLVRETREFRKSLIVKDGGDEVYLLNTPFSGILDMWKTFCHFNAMKF